MYFTFKAAIPGKSAAPIPLYSPSNWTGDRRLDNCTGACA